VGRVTMGQRDVWVGRRWDRGACGSGDDGTEGRVGRATMGQRKRSRQMGRQGRKGAAEERQVLCVAVLEGRKGEVERRWDAYNKMPPMHMSIYTQMCRSCPGSIPLPPPRHTRTVQDARGQRSRGVPRVHGAQEDRRHEPLEDRRVEGAGAGADGGAEHLQGGGGDLQV